MEADDYATYRLTGASGVFGWHLKAWGPGDFGNVGVMPETNPLTAVFRVLLAQIGAGLALAITGFWISGVVAAYSAMLGNLVCVVPNTFLGLRIIAGGAGGDARALLRASWLGAIGKLVLTAALFTVVFVLVKPLGPVWFFAGFMLTQAVIWAAPVLTRDSGSSMAG